MKSHGGTEGEPEARGCQAVGDTQREPPEASLRAALKVSHQKPAKTMLVFQPSAKEFQKTGLHRHSGHFVRAAHFVTLTSQRQ